MLKIVKWVRHLSPVVTLVGTFLGSLVWVYATFATIKYVDEKGSESVKYTDSKFNEAGVLLREINNRSKQMDRRLWELQGKPRNRLPSSQGE